MKDVLKLAALVAAAAALAWGFLSQAPRGQRLERGAAAPALRLPALDGETVDLQALRGHVVVVNFWATWCPPCVQEMPSLEKLHRTLAGDGLKVLAVSVDEDEAALRAFVRRAGLTFPVLRDPGGRGPSAAFLTAGYPETYVLDPQGRVLETYVGPAEWATPAAIDHFRELLARFGARADARPPERGRRPRGAPGPRDAQARHEPVRLRPAGAERGASADPGTGAGEAPPTRLRGTARAPGRARRVALRAGVA